LTAFFNKFVYCYLWGSPRFVIGL